MANSEFVNLAPNPEARCHEYKARRNECYILAHLHVALGHTSNEKLARMMAQNGAKDEVLDAIKQLKCQICTQVQAPQATPKASFTRPMSFNERLVSDTFYVWDAEGLDVHGGRGVKGCGGDFHSGASAG